MITAACSWLLGGGPFLSNAAVSDESSYLTTAFPSRQWTLTGYMLIVSTPLCVRGAAHFLVFKNMHCPYFVWTFEDLTFTFSWTFCVQLNENETTLCMVLWKHANRLVLTDYRHFFCSCSCTLANLCPKAFLHILLAGNSTNNTLFADLDKSSGQFGCKENVNPWRM